MPTLQEWIDCEGLPVAKCNGYRRHRGLPPLPDNATAPRAGSQQKPGCGKNRTAARGKPGTKFKELAESLGIATIEGCSCNAVRNEMDGIGVDGCRDRRACLLGKIRKNAARLSWTDALSAAASALRTGLAFTLDVRDPLGSLFDHAVNLADAESAKGPIE